MDKEEEWEANSSSNDADYDVSKHQGTDLKASQNNTIIIVGDFDSHVSKPPALLGASEASNLYLSGVTEHNLGSRALPHFESDLSKVRRENCNRTKDPPQNVVPSILPAVGSEGTAVQANSPSPISFCESDIGTEMERKYSEHHGEIELKENGRVRFAEESK